MKYPGLTHRQPIKRSLGFCLLFSLLTLYASSKATQSAAKQARDFYLPFVVHSDQLHLELEPFATGFDTDTITDIAHIPADGRLFIVQREGIIRIVYPDGQIEPVPFLDWRGKVALENWEQGLLGLVFHPRFPRVPYFYISYTDLDSHIRLARFFVSHKTPNTADPNSVVHLLTVPKPQVDGSPSRIHNGGDLAFGPDGYLYISLGDGGPLSANGQPGDPNNHGQRLDTLLGKILRIDVNPERGRPPDCGQANYSVPADNPYVGGAGCAEIWASGLRNPWRINFDSLTGDLYISDVGENLREEINHLPGDSTGGVNFGWHCYEGREDYSRHFSPVAADCDPEAEYTFSVYEYSSAYTNMCAVIGGLVYRGQQYPPLYGRYLFADFCQGSLWALSKPADGAISGDWRAQLVGHTDMLITTFGEDMNGELYASGRIPGNKNTLYRIIVH